MEFFDSMESFNKSRDVREYMPVSLYNDIVQRHISGNGLQDEICRYLERKNTTPDAYTCYVHRAVLDMIAMVRNDRLSDIVDNFGTY